MKSLVFIPAYAKTEIKRNILRRCIAACKSFGMDIMLTSHSPLPEDIITSVEYYIYDSDNRFGQTPGTYVWKSVGNVTTYIKSKGSHEYPIIRLLRNGLHLAKVNKYDVMIGLDFDNILSEQDIKKILELKDRMIQENKEFVFFYPPEATWVVDGKDVTGIYYDLYVTIAKLDSYLNTFDAYFPHTLEDYNLNFGRTEPNRPQCFEHYMYDAFKTKRGNTIIIEDYVKNYLNTSSINESQHTTNVYLILPGNDGKDYLYISNDTKFRQLFKVFINTTSNNILYNKEYELHATTVTESFKLIELKEDCNIKILVFQDNSIIDEHELHYEQHRRDEYTSNGKVEIKT